MKYEILGAMIAKGMLSMLRVERNADLDHVDGNGVSVTQYGYAPSGIAASKLLQDSKGHVVLRYKLLGDCPSGVLASDVRDMLKRNEKILVFHVGKMVASAIVFKGTLDLDLVETLCVSISENLRPRDSQRSRMYAMGHQISRGLGRITERDARKLAAKITADFCIPANKVLYLNDLESTRNDGLCYTIPFDALAAEPAFNVITCRANSASMVWLDTVLHELAHTVVRYEYGNDKAIGHGPGFVALYVELLVKYGPRRQDCTDDTQLTDYYAGIAKQCKVKVDEHCIRIGDGWYKPKPVKRATVKRRRASI